MAIAEFAIAVVDAARDCKSRLAVGRSVPVALVRSSRASVYLLLAAVGLASCEAAPVTEPKQQSVSRSTCDDLWSAPQLTSILKKVAVANVPATPEQLSDGSLPTRDELLGLQALKAAIKSCDARTYAAPNSAADSYLRRRDVLLAQLIDGVIPFGEFNGRRAYARRQMLSYIEASKITMWPRPEVVEEISARTPLCFVTGLASTQRTICL